MAKNDFQYGGWNSYTLQCGTIMTLNSPGGSILQCDTWLWDDAIEFAQTSAILEFYICFDFDHITAVDMSCCTSLRNFI